jgi:uncharacterized membrane protein
MKKIYFILIGIVLLIGGFIVFNSMTGKVIEELGTIEIPVSEISSNAQFYVYSYNGVNIKYFAVRSKDGSIKTAFDECDVCFNNRKGYSQDGEVMICNNCGNRYPISGLGTENLAGGGCWPGYLQNRIEGDNLVIEILDLNKGVRLFR